MGGGLMRDLLITFIGKLVGMGGYVAFRAVLIMFVAAAVHKRFDVFAAIGYFEAIEWSLAYGLLRELFHKDEERSLRDEE